MRTRPTTAAFIPPPAVSRTYQPPAGPRPAEGGSEPSGVDAAGQSPFLLAGTREGLASVPVALAGAVAAASATRRRRGPLPEGAPNEVMRAARNELGLAEVPERGAGTDVALGRMAQLLLGNGLDLSHPAAAAHLQPPPLAVAVAADALASTSNASLDTYDSGPSAIAVERWLVAALARLAGLGPRADGVLTPGGSLSNLMALLLARDAAARRRGVNARRDGVAAFARPVVFCSEVAHFSVHRACAALGLGEAAVRPVPVDARRRMCPDALAEGLAAVRTEETVLAVVATAGTTDFGTLDPLIAIADLAAAHGVWLHVDAAYGFGALFSDRLAGKLQGVERADSITLDLHKLGWQPAASSALLVADVAAFAALDREVDYLNPSDDAAVGYDGLLGRSLQTTRRPDAVKMAATLMAHGRRGLGAMVDACHSLACHAEQRIEREPDLELVSPAELTTVVFRYRPHAMAAERPEERSAAADLDDLNASLRRRLLETGTALVGRTAVALPGADAPKRVCLKLTLLNPTATAADVDALIDVVLAAGAACRSGRNGGVR